MIPSKEKSFLHLQKRNSSLHSRENLPAFYEHLLARGKTKMQALVAVMRKLLHAIFGMFKHHQTFDGCKVYNLVRVAAPQPAAQEVA
jgi:transposase